jgi:hypothetical protein
MKVYVARSGGHKITKRCGKEWQGVVATSDDHGGDAHKMKDMMIK